MSVFAFPYKYEVRFGALFQNIHQQLYLCKNMCAFCVFSYKYGVRTSNSFNIFTKHCTFLYTIFTFCVFAYKFVHTPQVLPSRGRRRRRRRAEKNLSELSFPQPPCAGKKYPVREHPSLRPCTYINPAKFAKKH